jgi:hypothetical protein
MKSVAVSESAVRTTVAAYCENYMYEDSLTMLQPDMQVRATRFGSAIASNWTRLQTNDRNAGTCWVTRQFVSIW